MFIFFIEPFLQIVLLVIIEIVPPSFNFNFNFCFCHCFIFSNVDRIRTCTIEQSLIAFNQFRHYITYTLFSILLPATRNCISLSPSHRCVGTEVYVYCLPFAPFIVNINAYCEGWENDDKRCFMRLQFMNWDTLSFVIEEGFEPSCHLWFSPIY